MKKIVSIISCLLSIAIVHGKEFTIVSYNIKHGVNMQGQLKLEDTVKVLQSLKADVIALQEVDNQTGRAGKVDQAKFLGEKLGMHHYFGKAMDYNGGGYGQAILSKYPILSTKVHKLPGDGEPRIALEVVVEPVKGQKVSFVSIHFDHRSEKVRQPQILALFKGLAEVTHPVVLLGDFNARPQSESIALFKKEWFNVPKKGPNLTMPADKPQSEIDFFMLRGWKTAGLTCKVIDEANVSDHRPILMKLDMTRVKN